MAKKPEIVLYNWHCVFMHGADEAGEFGEWNVQAETIRDALNACEEYLEDSDFENPEIILIEDTESVEEIP